MIKWNTKIKIIASFTLRLHKEHSLLLKHLNQYLIIHEMNVGFEYINLLRKCTSSIPLAVI